MAQEGPYVTVVAVSGSVEACKSGESEYQKVAEDAVLVQGDKIKTGQDSYAELAFDEEDKNIVRLDANTFAELLLEEDEKMSLLEGEVFSTIGELPAGSAFEIRTPTAVTGVRGTDWLTRVENEETVVEAIEGEPYVRGIQEDGQVMQERVAVSSGYMTRVGRFKRPGQLMRLDIERQRKWNVMKNDLRQRAHDAMLRRKALPPQMRKPEAKMQGQRRLKDRILPPPRRIIR
jgi:hypothetical protein